LPGRKEVREFDGEGKKAVDIMATFRWKTVDKAGKRWKGNFNAYPSASASNLLDYQIYKGSGGKVWESNPPGTSIAPYRI
jgi:hypothetical protein